MWGANGGFNRWMGGLRCGVVMVVFKGGWVDYGVGC